MFSVYHIEKLFRSQQFESLLRGVCPIGMDLSLPHRVRISQHPAAVTALGLRRVLELTYGQTQLSRDMTQSLLAMQADNGSFDNDPLSTAAAAEAMYRVLQEENPVSNEKDEHTALRAQVADAMDRAWQALESMQDSDGLFRFADDRSAQDRAMTAAFIAMLVGMSETCRHQVRLNAIADWFEDNDRLVDGSTMEVWRLALIEQQALTGQASKSNQMAAIAA